MRYTSKGFKSSLLDHIVSESRQLRTNLAGYIYTVPEFWWVGHTLLNTTMKYSQDVREDSLALRGTWSVIVNVGFFQHVTFFKAHEIYRITYKLNFLFSLVVQLQDNSFRLDAALRVSYTPRYMLLGATVALPRLHATFFVCTSLVPAVRLLYS